MLQTNKQTDEDKLNTVEELHGNMQNDALNVEFDCTNLQQTIEIFKVIIGH